MGEKLNLPVVTDAVKRVEKTKPLKELSPQERRKSLQRAFMPAKNQARWKSVLIVDDIYTTGSTIDAVSRVLKETQRAEFIYFLTIAIGIGNN